MICEVGVLNGTGLAIWCDLFPHARVIGLDIDLSNFNRNIDNLHNLGAFQHNEAELYEYDRFVYSTQYLDRILDGDRIDIFIDDGQHSDPAILITLESVRPHLANQFVYFIEDNAWVHRKLRSDCGHRFSLFSDSQLSVLTSRVVD